MKYLIDKLQSLFKTDIRFIIRGGLWLFSGQIIISGMSFVLALIFARYVSKEIYGSYKYILAAANILAIVTLSGLSTAVTRAVAQGFDILRKAFVMGIKWSMLMAVISGGISIYYYFNNNIPLSLSFLVIALCNPIIQSTNIFDAYLIGKKDFKTNVLFSALLNLIPTLAIIGALLLGYRTFLTLVVTYFITVSITSSILYLLTIRKYHPKENIQPGLITYARQLSILNIFTSIVDQIDAILIFHFLGAAELAIYSFAIAIPEQIKALFKSAYSLSIAKFAQRSYEEIQQNMYRKMILFAVVVLAATAAYIVAAPLIFNILFPQYVSSIHYSQIFSLSLVSIILVLPLSLLHSHQRTRELYVLNSVVTVAHVVFLFIGVYFFGLIGAIMARIASRFINLTLTVFISIIVVHYKHDGQ